jgi:hypothetical protein
MQTRQAYIETNGPAAMNDLQAKVSNSDAHVQTLSRMAQTRLGNKQTPAVPPSDVRLGMCGNVTTGQNSMGSAVCSVRGGTLQAQVRQFSVEWSSGSMKPGNRQDCQHLMAVTTIGRWWLTFRHMLCKHMLGPVQEHCMCNFTRAHSLVMH